MTHSKWVGTLQDKLGVTGEYGWNDSTYLESPVNSGMFEHGEQLSKQKSN